MHKPSTALAVLVLTVGLSACSIGVESSPSDSEPRGTNHQTSGAEDAPERGTSVEPATSAPEPATPAPAFSEFGQSHTWKDGLSVLVETVGPFSPSEWAAGGEKSPRHLKFRVTVVNGTGAVWDPSMDSISLQSGNTEGDQVFDSEQGLSGAPTTPLLPGREATYAVGFGVTAPDDLVMQFTPGDWTHDPAIFVSGS